MCRLWTTCVARASASFVAGASSWTYIVISSYCSEEQNEMLDCQPPDAYYWPRLSLSAPLQSSESHLIPPNFAAPTPPIFLLISAKSRQEKTFWQHIVNRFQVSIEEEDEFESLVPVKVKVLVFALQHTGWSINSSPSAPQKGQHLFSTTARTSSLIFLSRATCSCSSSCSTSKLAWNSMRSIVFAAWRSSNGGIAREFCSVMQATDSKCGGACFSYSNRLNR